MTRALMLERPTFWTEASDPESWFRALDVLVSKPAENGSPRAVADRALLGVISRRGAIGLFGLVDDLLPGVGLVVRDRDGYWNASDEALVLLRQWKEEPSRGLALLAAYLVRESVWLRLLLLRLHRQEWALAGWAETRSNRAGLKAGSSLVLHSHHAPDEWFAGLESHTASRWLARAHCEALAYSPDVLARKPSKDDLSLTPLTAPLLLLESVGWLSRTGALTLPRQLVADLTGTATPAQALAELTSGHADVRGFVAAEPVLRELLATFGQSLSDEAFAQWMDALIDEAMRNGALELLAAEPGQARHGRGLHADPAQKLVRWVVHTEFNDAFHSAWRALETRPELTP